MKKLVMCFLVGFAAVQTAVAQVQIKDLQTEQIKQQIVALAKSFEGQGDPDFAKQNALQPLVQQLLAVAPQPSVQERLPLIVGAWKQVWGSYSYRNDDRGVDPELGTEEIYQVISSDGYYYNASYLYENGDRNKKRIGLLRGEYKLDTENQNLIKVQFTDYPGASQKSSDLELWQLPALAEAGTLPNQITIVPSPIVRMFFGGGQLREVYTDQDLRITYGSSKKSQDKETIYIMTRVQ